MNENEIKNERRDFLKKIGAIVGVSISLPVISSVISSCEQDENPIPQPPKELTEIDLNRYPSLNTVGGSVKILLPGKNNNHPIILYRKSENEIVVLSSICLHAGCEVNLPQAGKIELRCPCHFVIFSAEDGSILTNPISGEWSGVPLDKFDVIEFDKTKNILKVEI